MSENLRKFFKRKKKTGKACHQIAPRICLRSPKLHPRRIPKRCMAEKWISWIYETASIIFASRKPWGSHGRKRVYFDEWKFQMQNKEWRQSQHGIWEKSGARRRLSWKCWNSCWMGCDFPIPSSANWCHVWSRRYHRGSTCFLWCQNTLQQHRWNDCFD